MATVAQIKVGTAGPAPALDRPATKVAFAAPAPLQVVVDKAGQAPTAPESPDKAPASPDAAGMLEAQDKVRALLAAKKADFLPILNFVEASEESMNALFPECTDEDYVGMQDAAKRFTKHESTLAERSCLDNQNYASVRIFVRVLGITAIAACQVLQQVGSDLNNNTIQWIGSGGQAFFGVIWSCTELVTIRKENNQKAAETGRDAARNELDELLKTPKETMELNARGLLRRWVALTTNCEDTLPGQLKDYITDNWTRSLPRIRQIAIDKIGSAAKADELLEPMTSAVRAIELAYSISQTGVSMDVGNTLEEFEKNRFSKLLATLQHNIQRKRSTSTPEAHASHANGGQSSHDERVTPPVPTLPLATLAEDNKHPGRPDERERVERKASGGAGNARRATGTGSLSKHRRGTNTLGRGSPVRRQAVSYGAARAMGKAIRQGKTPRRQPQQKGQQTQLVLRKGRQTAV